MPKVKFTTIISGMSGKSQGSVFASNASGAYFRNNTSKVKPKTAANSLKKAAFTTVSQYWKSLTFDQQSAWAEAAQNFPKLNAFGDTVTPSGYQLFMSLNTARSTAALPPLIAPPVGRSLPDPGAIEVENPAEFQFMPQSFLGTYSRYAPDAVYNYSALDIPSSSPISSLSGITMRVNFAGAPVLDYSTYSTIRLLGNSATDGEYFTFSLVRQSNGLWKLSYTQGAADGVWIITSTDQRLDFSKPFHIGIVYPSSVITDVQLYLNGTDVTGVSTITGSPSAESTTGTMYIGDSENAFPNKFALSDFRIHSEPLTAEQMLLVSNGYVLETENGIWEMNKIDSEGKTYSSFGSIGQFFTISTIVSPKAVIFPMSAGLVPTMVLNVPGSGLSGVLLNVYATPAISTGRGGETSNWRLLTQVAWTAPMLIPVSDLWLSKFGGFPPGSNIVFKIEVFDSETGYIPASAIKPPRRVRFKAGSEITAHVN